MATTSFKGGDCAGKSYVECILITPPEEFCLDICHSDRCVGHNLNAIQKGKQWIIQSEEGPMNCCYNEIGSYFGGPERRQCHVCCPPGKWPNYTATPNYTSALDGTDLHAGAASGSYSAVELGAFAGVGAGLAIAALSIGAFAARRRRSTTCSRLAPLEQQQRGQQQQRLELNATQDVESRASGLMSS